MRDQHPEAFNILILCLETLQKTGWKSFTLEHVAQEHEIPLETIQTWYSTKEKFLEAFFAFIEYQSRSKLSLDDLTDRKDQLLECFLVRLEVLEPYKGICMDIYEASFFDLHLAYMLSKTLKHYLFFVWEAVFGHSSVCVKPVVISVLFGVYAFGVKQWLQDSTCDLESSGVFFDQMLSQVMPFLEPIQCAS